MEDPALFTGGNHGDEYEGPVALMNLAVDLDPAAVTGHVITVAGFNFSAFRAATRTSPVDRVSLNRAVPGSPTGTVTQKIADCFNHVLVPKSDLVLGFHSGCKTPDFLPFAAAHSLDDRTQEATVTAPLTVAAPRSGIVASRHFPGLIQAGDRLAVIADVVGWSDPTPEGPPVPRGNTR